MNSWLDSDSRFECIWNDCMGENVAIIIRFSPRLSNFWEELFILDGFSSFFFWNSHLQTKRSRRTSSPLDTDCRFQCTCMNKNDAMQKDVGTNANYIDIQVPDGLVGNCCHCHLINFDVVFQTLTLSLSLSLCLWMTFAWTLLTLLRRWNFFIQFPLKNKRASFPFTNTANGIQADCLIADFFFSSLSPVSGISRWFLRCRVRRCGGGEEAFGRVRFPHPRLAAGGGVGHRTGHAGRRVGSARRRHSHRHQRRQRPRLVPFGGGAHSPRRWDPQQRPTPPFCCAVSFSRVSSFVKIECFSNEQKET